jgi:aspartate/methionine/tyrosine aminotransferase
VYLDALFETTPRTSFTLGDEFIAASSLTKVYGLNGLRCGWIFAEPPLAERMWRLTELFNNIGVHVAERLSLAALERLEPVAARSRSLLRANAAVLNDFLRSRDDLRAAEHGAGTVSFPRVVRGDAGRLCEVARARFDTAVVPGSFFGAPEHVRIGLGIDTDSLRAGLERLGAALDTLR